MALNETITSGIYDWRNGVQASVCDAVISIGTIIGTLGAAVFNPDGQARLSYWFTPNTKLTASYHVDAYFKALRTLDIVNADRIYQGPIFAADHEILIPVAERSSAFLHNGK